MKFFKTVLTVAFFFPALSQAATLGSNAIIDGDAETGLLLGWTLNGVGLVTDAEAAPTPTFGNFSFSGITGDRSDRAQQIIDLTAHAALIDAGNLQWTLGAQLQSRNLGTESDTVSLVLEFLASDSQFLRNVSLTDPSASDGQFDWNAVSDTGIVPFGTRLVSVNLEFLRSGSGLSTDSFADDVSLVFQDVSQSVPVVPLPASVPLLIVALLSFAAIKRKQAQA